MCLVEVEGLVFLVLGGRCAMGLSCGGGGAGVDSDHLDLLMLALSTCRLLKAYPRLNDGCLSQSKINEGIILLKSEL